MSPLENYKNLKGYLSLTGQCRLADETIESLCKRIEELEKALGEVSRIAEERIEEIEKALIATENLSNKK